MRQRVRILLYFVDIPVAHHPIRSAVRIQAPQGRRNKQLEKYIVYAPHLRSYFPQNLTIHEGRARRGINSHNEISDDQEDRGVWRISKTELDPTVDGDEATLSSRNSRNHPVPRGITETVKGTRETIAAWVYEGI